VHRFWSFIRSQPVGRWYKIDIKDALFGVGGRLLIDLCYGNRPVNLQLARRSCPSLVRLVLLEQRCSPARSTRRILRSRIDYELSIRHSGATSRKSCPDLLSTFGCCTFPAAQDETNLPGDDQPPAALGTAASLSGAG
jgi:hypothetical protein